MTADLKIAVLSIEKPGLPDPGNDCPREYLERNTMDQRVEDVHTVISSLRGHHPGWDNRLYVAGGSEGATVASLVAPALPETRALILMAGGGGFSMADEMLLLREKRMLEQGSSETQVAEALAEMRLKFEEIRGNPTSELFWFGETNTYKWWASILFADLVGALRDFAQPLYMIHGTADESVPVESADALAANLSANGKTKLTYVRREGLSHSFRDASGNSFLEHTFASAFLWLMKQEDLALRTEFLALIKEDSNHPALPAIIEKMARTDAKNTQGLKTLISQSGFPLISTHGAQANQDAWLIVQHADHDIEFQRSTLKLLAAAMKQKDTIIPRVAYLTDRVMVNEALQTGRQPLQRFGTQGRIRAMAVRSRSPEKIGGDDRTRTGTRQFCKLFP